MARNPSHDQLKPGHKVVITRGDYFDQEGGIVEIRDDRTALVSIRQHLVSSSHVQYIRRCSHQICSVFCLSRTWYAMKKTEG